MIHDRFVPNISHIVILNCFFECMRAKCAQGDGNETKRRGDSEEHKGEKGEVISD